MDDLAITVAKKTGDYSVLSHSDICVVALTYELDSQEKEKSEDLQVLLSTSPRRICAKCIR